ncbi:MAG: NifB/NifX family molybdenum-iron cluster-binding protein [Clostridia bacterium]|nr:NifB/NifX family molybdenum-iron cluster-binding protein [Clostridia bacterium]
MRIAIPYENNMVFQHFGHTTRFAMYDVQDGQIVSSVVIPALGSGHGALAGFLKNSRVDVVICGGIGGGAQQALKEAGIQLYGGVQGECQAAVEAFVAGQLNYDPEARCDHHDHGEHTCGEHTCGEHDCGGSCHH